MGDIYGMIAPDMFDSGICGALFYEYSKAYEEKKEITLTELHQAVAAAGYQDYEITEAIKKCAGQRAMAFQAKGYATTILNHYKKTCVERVLERAEIKEATVDEGIDRLITDLEILRGGEVSEGQTIAELAEQYEGDYFTDREKALVFIGEDQIDGLTGGLQGGDLALVAARPSIGKSALATQWAESFARQGKKVAYYNLEMQNRSCFERFVAAKSGIEITRIRRATRFHNDEKEKYDKAIAELKTQTGITLFTGSKKVSDIRNDIRKTKPNIVIVDYLQLLICDNRYQGNRVAEVGQISHDLKAIAMSFDIPVICLAQLSRAVEGRRDHKPMLSDLRESGDLEQDASVVFFLYNTDETDRSKKMLDVQKSRQGKTGSVEMIFDGARLHFEIAGNETPFD